MLADPAGLIATLTLNAEQEIPNFTAPRQLRTREENARDKKVNYARHAPDNGVLEAEIEQLKQDGVGNEHECENSIRTIHHWSRQQNENLETRKTKSNASDIETRFVIGANQIFLPPFYSPCIEQWPYILVSMDTTHVEPSSTATGTE